MFYSYYDVIATKHSLPFGTILNSFKMEHF